MRRYRIVVGVDLTEYADIVVEHALDQAARHDRPELHFLTVRERVRPSAEDIKHALWECVQPSLEAFNRHAQEWRARFHIRRGAPDEQIPMLAAEIAADLIVIGQFGVHHPKHTDKSVANHVLQAAVCPTLVLGMPAAAELSPQCPTCIAVREETDGERWFCAHHVDPSHRLDRVMTPMSTWTGGSPTWGS
jgi:nucleotide-binding universal stress UspA family protein